MLHLYNIVKSDNLNYSFTTSNNIEYQIVFFEDHTLNEISENDYTNTYQFLIEKTNGNIEPLDFKVRNTICGIIQDFFENIENSLLFICDNNDKKSHLRKNHFELWYEKFSSNTTINKLNIDISDDENHYTFASLLIREDHPQYNLIKNDFLNIPSVLDK